MECPLTAAETIPLRASNSTGISFKLKEHKHWHSTSKDISPYVGEGVNLTKLKLTAECLG